MSEQLKFENAVYLRKEDCTGCTNCIKRCPTGAIRVREGKAHIIKEFCIDCGECIRVCQHHAKVADHDPLAMISDFKYRVALPAPTLYAQFNNLDDSNILLSALLELGFDNVYEVGEGAEIVSKMTRAYLQEHRDETPFISTACPSIVRLIRIRYPNLISHMLPILPPVEISAISARRAAIEKTGLASKDIGIFFISPCPAKVSACRHPLFSNSTNVDGILSIKEVYPALLPLMKKVAQAPRNMAKAGRLGIGWGHSEGESAGLMTDNYLAADGIENVIRTLDDFESSKLSDLLFVELNACNGGCVGGTLTVENPYVARARLKRIIRNLPPSQDPAVPTDFGYWTKRVEYEPVFKLGDNFKENLAMMKEIGDIEKSLPGIDCGACGAPSCRALAEDIVKNMAKKSDCMYVLRAMMDENESRDL